MSKNCFKTTTNSTLQKHQRGCLRRYQGMEYESDDSEVEILHDAIRDESFLFSTSPPSPIFDELNPKSADRATNCPTSKSTERKLRTIEIIGVSTIKTLMFFFLFLMLKACFFFFHFIAVLTIHSLICILVWIVMALPNLCLRR